MPAATDIKTYLAANMPEDDTSTVGGAIDATGRVIDDQFTAAAAPEVVSTSASDTQTCTIVGRAVSGEILTEANSLTGTTPVLWSNTFERILKITLSTAAVGTITVKQGSGGTTRHTFAAGEDLCRIMFYKASASPSGGSSQVRYEKVFIKNTHATESALSMSVAIQTDAAGYYDMDLEDAVDDTGTSSNRKTVPTGIVGGGWGDGPVSVPGGDLAAGEAIGLWIRQTLAAGLSPDTDVITTRSEFESA